MGGDQLITSGGLAAPPGRSSTLAAGAPRPGPAVAARAGGASPRRNPAPIPCPPGNLASAPTGAVSAPWDVASSVPAIRPRRAWPTDREFVLTSGLAMERCRRSANSSTARGLTGVGAVAGGRRGTPAVIAPGARPGGAERSKPCGQMSRRDGSGAVRGSQRGPPAGSGMLGYSRQGGRRTVGVPARQRWAGQPWRPGRRVEAVSAIPPDGRPLARKRQGCSPYGDVSEAARGHPP